MTTCLIIIIEKICSGLLNIILASIIVTIIVGITIVKDRITNNLSPLPINFNPCNDFGSIEENLLHFILMGLLSNHKFDFIGADY